MSEIDLEAAIEAAAAPIWHESNPGYPVRECDAWDECEALARSALKAAAPLIERAVREQAARELMAWAETHERLSTLRRHIHMCARRIGPKMTDQEVVEALQRGDFVACHLDDAGRAIPPGETTEVTDAH